MPYDPTDLNDAINAVRAWADALDALMTEHHNAVCARVTSEWRRQHGMPDEVWRLATWALGLTALRGYTRHWHPEIGIDDPKRPCSVQITWVRIGPRSVGGE